MSTIVSAGQPIKAGCLTIEQVVFEPKYLATLLASNSIAAKSHTGLAVAAVDQQEVEALLHAALSDWVDFFFVPTPKPFVMYADHDEYTTFYGNPRSNLNRVAEALSERGFESVRDYERRL